MKDGRFSSVSRIENKKYLKKHKKSLNSRPMQVPQDDFKSEHLQYGLTEWMIYCKKCSCFSLCFTMLIFKIKGITSISSEKCFNYIIIFFF